MSLLGLLQAAPGMLNGLGLPVIVYHRQSLKTTVLAQADVTSLVLAANAAIGATALQAAHGGDSMAGELPAGLVLTTGAVNLTLTAQAVANGGTTLSLPVAALAAGLTAGAVLAVPAAVQIPYVFRPRAAHRQFAPGAGIITGKVRGVLTGTVEPPIGAMLQGEEIFKVDAIAGGTHAWRVEAGKQGS